MRRRRAPGQLATPAGLWTDHLLQAKFKGEPIAPSTFPVHQLLSSLSCMVKVSSLSCMVNVILVLHGESVIFVLHGESDVVHNIPDNPLRTSQFILSDWISGCASPISPKHVERERERERGGGGGERERQTHALLATEYSAIRFEWI